MQAWQFNLTHTKKRSFGSLQQKLCNNHKSFDYYLTIEDDYPNKNTHVFPYSINESFSSGIQVCLYPQTSSFFLHFSPQTKQSTSSMLEEQRQQIFFIFLINSLFIFPSSGLFLHQDSSFPNTVPSTGAKYLIYLLIFISLCRSLGPRAVLWVSFAQSKSRVNQHTIKMGSQETIIKNSCEEHNSFRKQNPKIVKCHEFSLSPQPIPRWVTVTQNKDH